MRIFLFMIFALLWVVVGSAWGSGCGPCYNYWGHYPTEADYEQHKWNIEAFRFLYCDDVFYQPFMPYNYRIPSGETPEFAESMGNSNANYWLTEGNKQYQAGFYTEAATSYSKAVLLNPTLGDGWIKMGNALFLLGKYQESLNAFDAMLKLDPKNNSAMLGKAQTLLALNRTADASAVLGRARSLTSR